MDDKLAPLIQLRKSHAHGVIMRGANRLTAMQKRKRNLTPADKEAARKLRALWDSAVARRKDEGRPLTQEGMAERLASALGRGTQGAVSQYLNGHIALNYRALLAFADEVGFDPKQVREDLPEQQLQAGTLRERTSGSTDAGAQSQIQVRDLLQSIAVTQSLLAVALAESIPDAAMAFVEKLRKLDPHVRNSLHVKTMIGGLEDEFANQAVRLQRAAARKPRVSGPRKP